jgi:hypothetical protein
MMLRRTVSLGFAGVCLTAIATMPAHAQGSFDGVPDP